MVWDGLVLVREGDVVTAIGSDGDDAWRAETGIRNELEPLDDLADASLRVLGPQSVAVIRPDSAVRPSVGNENAEWLVATIDTQTGKVSGPHLITGYPDIGDIGAFFGSTVDWPTPHPASTAWLAPDGTVGEFTSDSRDIEGIQVSQGPTFAVGDLLFEGFTGQERSSITPDRYDGFVGDGWTSDEIAPEGFPQYEAYPEATDGRRALVAAWGVGGPLSVIDSTAGEVVSFTECGSQPEPQQIRAGVLPSSPSGRFVLTGALLVDMDEKTDRCISLGGGRTQVPDSVDESGTAYTKTRGPSDEPVIVASGLDGDDVVAPVTETTVAPLGFISEGVAIHYSPDTGMIGANPLVSDQDLPSDPPPAPGDAVGGPQTCGTIASHAGGVVVEIVAGELTCAEAEDLLTTYYFDPPEVPQGSGGFVTVGEWVCNSSSTQEEGRASTCRTQAGGEVIALD